MTVAGNEDVRSGEPGDTQQNEHGGRHGGSEQSVPTGVPRKRGRRGGVDAAQDRRPQHGRCLEHGHCLEEGPLVLVRRGRGTTLCAPFKVQTQAAFICGRQFRAARQKFGERVMVSHVSAPYRRRKRSRARDSRWRMAVPRTPSITPISSVLNPATSKR